MCKSRLILLEGLPGTGKTTNAYFLYTQMGRHDSAVKWIHEVTRPHPVLFFDEACLSHAAYAAFLAAHPDARPMLDSIAERRKTTVGIDLLEVAWQLQGAQKDVLFQTLRQYDAWNLTLGQRCQAALEKWESFVERAMDGGDTIYILDSALFQYQIFSFLLKDRPYEELERFVAQLLHIVSPLEPMLIYLHRASTEAAITALENTRGTESMERMWERDQHEPYYQGKPTGKAGFSQFLLDYGKAAAQLYATACCNKMSIDISNEQWRQYEDAMLSRLQLQRAAFPEASPPDGIYENKAHGWRIEVESGRIREPEGKRRLLTPKSERSYYVECLPVTLRFLDDDTIVTEGMQIAAQWTTLGTVYRRVEK